MTAFWDAWNWNPLIGAVLALATWRYMNGVWQLWGRAGTGRGVRRWQVAAFWGGIAVLFVALLSPIDTWSTASLSMHMVQHMLLMLAAPPLLFLGLPPVARMNMLPRQWRQGAARWWHRRRVLQQLWHHFTHPFVGWVSYAMVLWIWHVPPLYEAAVIHPVVHTVEHSSFFGAALLFWWRLDQNPGLGVFLVFTTAIHSSILGALMTFSNQVWYPIYGSLQSQQVAGLIMWIPGKVIFVAAGLLLLWRWLYQLERNDRKISA